MLTLRTYNVCFVSLLSASRRAGAHSVPEVPSQEHPITHRNPARPAPGHEPQGKHDPARAELVAVVGPLTIYNDYSKRTSGVFFYF